MLPPGAVPEDQKTKIPVFDNTKDDPEFSHTEVGNMSLVGAGFECSITIFKGSYKRYSGQGVGTETERPPAPLGISSSGKHTYMYSCTNGQLFSCLILKGRK